MVGACFRKDRNTDPSKILAFSHLRDDSLCMAGTGSKRAEALDGVGRANMFPLSGDFAAKARSVLTASFTIPD